MRSEALNELGSALAKFQGEIQTVGKDAVNPHFKSRFASLEVVVTTAGPVLAKHGLSVSQFVSRDEDSDTLVTYLLHESGQFISHEMRLHLIKDDPQAQGSAITYARRYSLMATLGLAPSDDDDGQVATNRVSQAEASGRPVRQVKREHPAPKTTEEMDTSSLRRILSGAGYTTKPAQLAFVADKAGVNVESLDQLGQTEIDQLLASLAKEPASA